MQTYLLSKERNNSIKELLITKPTILYMSPKVSNPGDELFPQKGSSYVPSGLSEIEYAKIKDKEKKNAAKKNFGMWGPRFKQTVTPGGDWMVQPGLWSMGFQSNRDPNSVPSQSKMSKEIQTWVKFTKKHSMAFFTVYALTQLIQIALVQLRTVFTKSLPLRAMLLPTTVMKMAVGNCGDWKVLFTKISTALFLACPVEIFVMERLNRRKLWSRRRSLFNIVGLAIFCLIAWDGILTGLVLGNVLS